MTLEEVKRRLVVLGILKPSHELETWRLLSRYAPEGALASVACYKLIDRSWRRDLDTPGRNWRPVLIVENDLLLDPSPQMFGRFLSAANVFKRPQAFGEQLLFQMHRFSFDFYDGYRVREQALSFQEQTLTVSGYASRGSGRRRKRFLFETIARFDEPVHFKVLGEAP